MWIAATLRARGAVLYLPRAVDPLDGLDPRDLLVD